MPKRDNKWRFTRHLLSQLSALYLLTIYDPQGKQYIIRGSYVTNINNFYNKKIDLAKSLLAKLEQRKKIDVQKIIHQGLYKLSQLEEKKYRCKQKRITSKDSKQQLLHAQIDYVESNGKIDNTKEKIAKTSKAIRNWYVDRENAINDYFNKIAKWIIKMYGDCETIIAGYNTNITRYACFAPLSSLSRARPAYYSDIKAEGASVAS